MNLNSILDSIGLGQKPPEDPTVLFHLQSAVQSPPQTPVSKLPLLQAVPEVSPLESIIELSPQSITVSQQTAICPPIPSQSGIGMLSIELILRITSLLEPVAAACFSLTCRGVFFSLGTDYIKGLKHNSEDRFKFLDLLQLDLPNHLTCFHCEKLHIIDQAEQHKRDNRHRLLGRIEQLPCWEVDEEELTNIFILPEFCSTIFRMTMKLYRQGHNYHKHLALLSRNASFESLRGTSKSMPLLHMGSGRISVAGSLIYRTQMIMLTPQSTPKVWRQLIIICPHISPRLSSCVDLEEDITECGYSGPHQPLKNRRGVISCQFCLTEFRVDVQPFGYEGQGLAIVVTRWQDLGEGKEYLDPKWRSHHDSCVVMAMRGKKIVWVQFDKGSLCTAFEGKDHRLFQFQDALGMSQWEKLLKPYETTRRILVKDGKRSQALGQYEEMCQSLVRCDNTS